MSTTTPVTVEELHAATLGPLPDWTDTTDRSLAYHWYLPGREPNDDGWRLTAKLYLRHRARVGYYASLETGLIMRGAYFWQESYALCGPAHGPRVEFPQTPAARFSKSRFDKLFAETLAGIRATATAEATAESILDEVLGGAQ